VFCVFILGPRPANSRTRRASWSRDIDVGGEGDDQHRYVEDDDDGWNLKLTPAPDTIAP
jgi:hypothetical protein